MKNNKPITEEQVAEFQEYLDKLSIFDLDMVNRIVFYKRQEALKEVLELKLMKDEEMPIHSGIYGDSNIKPDVRNKLRQQLRASIKEMIK